MVGVNFWNFWWNFSMFCEKLQNVCSVAANPDQMDKNGCDFRTQRPPKYSLQTSSPQKSCIPVLRFMPLFWMQCNSFYFPLRWSVIPFLLQGYVAWLNSANGSWFVQALSLCIDRYHDTMDFLQVIFPMFYEINFLKLGMISENFFGFETVSSHFLHGQFGGNKKFIEVSDLIYVVGTSF